MDTFTNPTPAAAGGNERRCIARSVSGQSIRIHTLGRFGIQIDGKTLSTRELRQQKPIALLQCVIALGGRGVNRDYLSATLWPEAEGDDAANTYDVTLHRLRKLLKHDKALIASDGRLTINNEIVWVDVWSFEKMLNDIDGAMRIPGKDTAETHLSWLLNQVMSRYQGGFLALEAHKPWGLSTHERLRSKLMRCIVQVGRRAEGDGQWPVAAEYYQTGIELDPLYELLYQRLMICYREADRKAEARSVYLRCHANLSSGLRVAPSMETEKILGTL